MSATTSAPKMSPAQQNAMARQAIFSQATPIIQRINSPTTIANVASGNNTITVNPLNIGFLRRFLVEVTATISNPGTAAVTLSPNGLDNLLANITFNDFTGNPRHNCSGRALSFVEAAKYGRIPGAALTSDSASGFGSNIKSNYAPATIAAAGTATVTRVFEIPIMVDTGRFMSGGLWLGVNNQSTLLKLTLNANPVPIGGDPLTAIYTGAAGTAGAITSATVTVSQDYWNFGPSLMDPKTGMPVLPTQDVSTAYMITETSSGLTFSAGQAASWNFPTFSKLLGTYFTFDNGNELNDGTDVSLISLVVSNYSIIKQFSPLLLDRLTRDVSRASYPAGTYALMSRMHPLDVSQYPSLQLQFTPSTVNSGAYALITTELLRPMQYMAAASGMGGV